MDISKSCSSDGAGDDRGNVDLGIGLGAGLLGEIISGSESDDANFFFLLTGVFLVCKKGRGKIKYHVE